MEGAEPVHQTLSTGVLLSQPVPDFLEQHFLLVIRELSRKSSGDVSEIGMRRHQDDHQRLLDPPSKSWKWTSTNTVNLL